MPRFLALTSRGLVPTLQDELNSLGYRFLKPHDSGVFFEADTEGLYRANLRVRCASRILYPILEFNVREPDWLYRRIQDFDFTRFIDPSGTIAVDAVVRESEMRDQRFVALKVKDAIVDQFSEKFGVRPNVDRDNPDLFVWIRIVNNEAFVAIDTSGDPLFKRGYRVKDVEAPLKEHIAAALIRKSGWDAQSPLVDPMCGSGTFLIEGALAALDIAPGTLRKGFRFQRMKNYEPEVWNQVVDAAMSMEKEDLPFKLYGYDISSDPIRACMQNARAAGVLDNISFKRRAVELLEPPEEKGMIITNPPYGERLLAQDEDLLLDIYRDFGYVLKNRFKGWTAWVLTNREDCPKIMGLKATDKIDVMNGPIQCRFLRFDIRTTP